MSEIMEDYDNFESIVRHYSDTDRRTLEMKSMQDSIVTLEYQVASIYKDMNKIINDFKKKEHQNDK